MLLYDYPYQKAICENNFSGVPNNLNQDLCPVEKLVA